MLPPAQKHMEIRISTRVPVLVCINMATDYWDDMVGHCTLSTWFIEKIV